jgi:hypothetical protein
VLTEKIGQPLISGAALGRLLLDGLHLFLHHTPLADV